MPLLLEQHNKVILAVAQALGVELYEVFQIEDSNDPKGYYRFTPYRLEYKDNSHLNPYWRESIVGFNFFFESTIIKPPFDPELHEEFWSYCYNDFQVLSAKWTGSAADYCRKAVGCIFRTREEAERMRPQKYKELTGKEWAEQ